MTPDKKRHIAAWVLLAVFVPMLLIASVHLHTEGPSAELTCDECVHHHCDGHLMQQTASSHDCLLCQFLTLPMLTAIVVAVAVPGRHHPVTPLACACRTCGAHVSSTGPRAPPAVCLHQ